MPGLALASPEEEKLHPDRAEDGYESANSWLLAQTRDRERFGLLFAENINYGFRRNAWALKPWAFALVVIALVMGALMAFESWTEELSTQIPALGLELWASLVFILVHASFFAFKIRAAWVRIAADAYAQQLLAACDVLDIERQA